MIGQCNPRHRANEFRCFLDEIEAAVPADLDVHLMLDNSATHKIKLIRDWLAKRPHYHVHFPYLRLVDQSGRTTVRPDDGAHDPT